MSITAEVICDSISDEGIRLTTLQLRYPKFIHGELMTHRVFSRNASSSRAIPVKRLIEDIRRDPAMPVFWGSNKPGMQAGEELDEESKRHAEEQWLGSMTSAIADVEWLVELGLHKQIANRILEPWCHINVVVTATEWSNFFALRRHPDAQPEMKALADAMWDAIEVNHPTLIKRNVWHLPYVRGYLNDRDLLPPGNQYNLNPLEQMLRCSVARCARVSYLTHEGKTSTIEEDIKLYDRLVGSHPMHASPAEHQATPDFRGDIWEYPEEHGNFKGWRQYRKWLLGENITDYEG